MGWARTLGQAKQYLMVHEYSKGHGLLYNAIAETESLEPFDWLFAMAAIFGTAATGLQYIPSSDFDSALPIADEAWRFFVMFKEMAKEENGAIVRLPLQAAARLLKRWEEKYDEIATGENPGD